MGCSQCERVSTNGHKDDRWFCGRSSAAQAYTKHNRSKRLALRAYSDQIESKYALNFFICRIFYAEPVSTSVENALVSIGYDLVAFPGMETLARVQSVQQEKPLVSFIRCHSLDERLDGIASIRFDDADMEWSCGCNIVLRQGADAAEDFAEGALQF